ncbi:hypothetical protein BCR33DRAFT_787641 [Rhizoclosmatium globosum]|uniref:SET domain-containing protein n=1 Tax=Rhizoclosmatium globosum TaxID=329046 RepID=A0A1Y2C0J9_9FUNG|nr:hypothetical protein BCR33DRAFT_787641 [Rhizoclosmatium globosum]|eukprot:ORY40552.1 hypothetical protein BCR33DRAFT_787641 [Rhizoclosmatium globosum]
MDETFVFGTKQRINVDIADINADHKPVGVKARDWVRIKSAWSKKLGKRANPKPVAYCSTMVPVPCVKVAYLTGRCRECYNRKYYMEQSIKVIAAFAGEPDVSKLLRLDSWVHSGNPLMYTFRGKCSTIGCKDLCVLTHPICSRCSSQQLGLSVVGSLIPGGGFGLVATKDFAAKERLPVTYGKWLISRAEKDAIEASTDPLQQARMAYLMELSKDTFIDGFGEESGILRYINNAPNSSLVNCRFVVNRKSQTVSVETTQKVPVGCEFLLVYRFTAKGHGVYWNKINSDTAERLTQRKQIVAAMKHVAS